MNPAECAALHKRAFEPQARGWRESEFAQFLADPKVILAGDRRAFALARIAGDEAEVLTLACDPDHRRQGLASACLAALLDAVRGAGGVLLFLDVAADNVPALGLYSKFGFEQVGRRAGYYRRSDTAQVDAIILQKTFDPGAGASPLTTK